MDAVHATETQTNGAQLQPQQPQPMGSAADTMFFQVDQFPDFDWAANFDFNGLDWTANTFNGTMGMG